MKSLKSIKNLTIKIAQKILSWEDFESLKIHLKNWDKKPPILIYTMGKVGSMTVYQFNSQIRRFKSEF
ncbi:MAG TPA: hypothetical protein DCF68_04845 [Cyanothece sp. UBA12306]|nr:hypothetical protein [Cyanothece sp. UBA12306]